MDETLESKVAGILEMLACVGNKEECVQGGGVPWNYAGTNGDPALATAVPQLAQLLPLKA